MSPISSRIRRARQPGLQAALTLVELLVVLSLVAVLSTVALRSVVGTLDQKNYDANIRQLEEIEKAVLGVDGRGGFLRDIGRLPVAVGDADYDPDTGNFLQLSELWLQGGLPAYQMASPPGDPEVRLSAGWRGPYLNLGITRTNLSDGFGKVLRLRQADNAVSNGGQPIASVISAGANNEIDEEDTGIDQDVAVFFEAIAGAVHPGPPSYPPQDENHWQTLVQVHVKRDDGLKFNDDDGRYLIIRAYGPVNGAPGTSKQVPVDLEELPPPDYEEIEGAQTLAISVLVPHGANVFRAYQIDGATSVPEVQAKIINDGNLPIPPFTVERISPTAHIVTDRFTVGPITLTLNEVSSP